MSRRSWTSTRHGTPAYVISAATRAPDGLGREQQPEPGGLARRRHGGQLPGVLEVGAQVLGRVVDREQGRIGRRCSARAGPSAPTARPSSSRPSTAGARRSRWWPRRRSWQRSTRTPAASSGGYHRAVSSHTHRGASTSRAPHVRRQVGQRQLALARRRRRPARARPAGARARSGSWGHPSIHRRCRDASQPQLDRCPGIAAGEPRSSAGRGTHPNDSDAEVRSTCGPAACCADARVVGPRRSCSPRDRHGREPRPGVAGRVRPPLRSRRTCPHVGL